MHQRPVLPEPAPLDPELLFTTLARHGVRFVVIGAMAARLQGFPRVTADTDITPERTPENLDRLATALVDLGARVFTESVPEGLAFDCTGAVLARAERWNLVTAAGRLDLAFTPAGTHGYAELRRRAMKFEVYETDLYAASLEDIIRSKQAADRPQDRQDVIILRELLNRRGV